MVTREIELSQACSFIADAKRWDEWSLFTLCKSYRGGGRDTLNWGSNAIHDIEAQLLYGMVRYIKPDNVIEVGTASGASANAILQALEDNGKGLLYSYDIDPKAGNKIDLFLTGRWRFTVCDFIKDTIELPPAQFAFEDGEHSYEFTRDALAKLAHVPHVMSHDACTDEVYSGFGVWKAFSEAFPNALRLKLAGAFTGLAIK